MNTDMAVAGGLQLPFPKSRQWQPILAGQPVAA
jgi:hypothetical protein